MNESQHPTSAVKSSLDTQRETSEIRDLLQHLDALQSVRADRKRRWIWELLQNAKDCGDKTATLKPAKVNVWVTLQRNRLTFAHDGVPFTLDNLLALARRASTKAFDDSDGNTGKYGTGFVTTHVLNRIVQVSGRLKGRNGLVDFSLCINRTANTFPDLRDELWKTYDIIDSFYESKQYSSSPGRLTTYDYELDDLAWELANTSLAEFIANLPFTLLINAPDAEPGLNQVTVSINGEQTVYQLSAPEPVIGNVKFSAFASQNHNGARNGILHYREGSVVLGIPAIFSAGQWKILPVGSVNKLFKDYPLVGTERWNLPFLVQSEDFQPPETRDGIRTAKAREDRPDPVADTNRNVLVIYQKASEKFFTQLQQLAPKGLYLLAESGMPQEFNEYTAEEWYRDHIQVPLRRFFIDQPLVLTRSGYVTIRTAKIPEFQALPENNEKFYELAVKMYADLFPEEDSFKDWQRIISQEKELWDQTVICTPEDLIKRLVEPNGLTRLLLTDNETLAEWLDALINFLYVSDRSALCDSYPVYLNQCNELALKVNLRIDPPLRREVKDAAEILGQKVLNILLHPGIHRKDGIAVFDEKEFYDLLNGKIGKLIPSAESKPIYAAVFTMLSIFPTKLERERPKWHEHIKVLLGDIIPGKTEAPEMYLFNGDPSEKASIRYVCWLIQEASTFENFVHTYFQDHAGSAYEWLNNFVDILHRTSDYTEFFRTYAIVPAQSGKFGKIDGSLFREDPANYCDEDIKDFYTLYAGKGNSRDKLIDKHIIRMELPPAPPGFITDPVDDFFKETISSTIDKDVAPDGKLNVLFHLLNAWLTRHPTEAAILYPHFHTHRPKLYVKAFGPEVSKMIMAIHASEKSLEEIEALTKLDMSAEDMGKLIAASQAVGGVARLVEAANQIQQDLWEAAWRKEVGDAAEEAFEKAISTDTTFKLENPDRGYDFEIKYGETKPYLLEIKSTVEFKETVKMSNLQGTTARDLADRYALCVVLRNAPDTKVTEEYFVQNARFVLNIGTIVSEKVTSMEQGIQLLREYNHGDIQTRLDTDRYSVNVSRSAWSEYLTFDEFVRYLKTEYFKINAAIVATIDSPVV